MRDGGLHYLERIVEAYDKAATAAVENYQGAETRSEGGENQYMARGRYWRPQLKQAEWDLLEWRMNAEIKSGENFLDEATKWVYADEKGVQVFALYGIGDGTEATPLYAVGGEKAAAYNAAMTEFMERSQKYDGDGRSVDPLSELPWRKEGSRSGNLSQTSRKAGDAEGVSELHGGSQRSDSGGVSGRGTENQRGVKDQFSIREIKGEDGTDYGKGVYLDSTLLEGLTDAERKEMMRERVKELGGQTITTYDPNGKAVDIRIAAPGEKFRNRNGRKVSATKDIAVKGNTVKIKQETVVLADEVIRTSQYKRSKPASYPHGWLDNNGKNAWDKRITYLQDKNNTVWEATLHIATSTNGVKHLYDISPIKKVGRARELATSTTGDIVAQNQTESQAQIRSSTLSDRDVLRIAAQMAKNSESRSLTDGDRSAPLNFGYHEAKHLIQSCFIQIEAVSSAFCLASCSVSAYSITSAIAPGKTPTRKNAPSVATKNFSPSRSTVRYFAERAAFTSVNRFSVNFFSIEVITARPSFFRTIQVCCVDIEIKTDFTAHIRRTRILKYTKSLSIADQFPGFNSISVFFLTESHSLISATASLMISAGFIRTALLWNIFLYAV